MRKKNTSSIKNVIIQNPVEVKIKDDEKKSKKALKYLADKIIIVVIVSVITVVLGNILISKIFTNKSDKPVSFSNSKYQDNSIEWNIQILPDQDTVFDKKQLLIAQAHIEVSQKVDDSTYIDMSQYDSISFNLKCSNSNFSINEFNIFTGQDHLQYIYKDSIPLGLNYQKVIIYLDKNKYINPTWQGNRSDIDFSKVFAFGFDIKSDTRLSSRTISISKISLTSMDNNEIHVDHYNAPEFMLCNVLSAWSFRIITIE
jgi:hypothetical protein